MQFDEQMLKLLRCVHVNTPWKYLLEHMEIVLENRINVEVGFDAEGLDSAPRAELERASARLSDRACRTTIHGPFWDLSPGSLDPLIRRATRHRLEQLFEMVSIFSPIQIVCHTGFDPRHHDGYRKVWMEHSCETWETVVKKCEDLKIPLLIENVWENDPNIHLELFSRLDSPYFGFCLDVGHQHSFSKTSLSVWLEALWERLGELHLHDNDGTRDAHYPIGRGGIDFRGLFNFLEDVDREPLITLEPHCEEHLAETLSGLLEVIHSRQPAAPCLQSGDDGETGRSWESSHLPKCVH